ncbi:MAG: TerC/Alx family metal homeostasis membrane protein [Bacteroidales bacterium]|nr:TerC/Alx family metal homeostasis membrane protein [Bacteroidales bacterium]
MNETLVFSLFLLFIALMLALDLGVFHKKDHVIGWKEAGIWVAVWFGMAMLFSLVVFLKGDVFHGIHDAASLKAYYATYFPGSVTHVYDDSLSFAQNLHLYRKTLGMEYLSGYFIEQALSIDNIFVMIMLFISFGIDRKYYHRVLFWGIIGAIVMRFAFIFAAAALVQRFAWVLAVFGLLLIYSGIQMFRDKKEAVDTEKHPAVRLASKVFRVDAQGEGHRFFIRRDHRLYITPLFVALLVIEFSDIVFAVDSIPAIFSITQDPYIVFFSNIFAIMGLRSLFFLLNNVVDRFWLLKFGLGGLLIFIGVKMLLHTFFHVEVPTGASLLVILGVLLFSMGFSVLFPKKGQAKVS